MENNIINAFNKPTTVNFKIIKSFLFYFTKINVVLFEEKSFNQKEYYNNLEIFKSKDNYILIYQVIDNLKEIGVDLENSMIFFYDISKNMYVYCGNDPLSGNIAIFLSETNKKQVYKLNK